MNATADPPIPLAWRARNHQLAEWAFARLVNRIDVWGGYKPERFRRPGESKVLTKPAKDKRGVIKLTTDVLAAHFRGYDVGDVCGLHTTSHIDTCRFGAGEIDRHDDSINPTITEAAAVFWYQKAVSLGFSPLLIDSDGKGGFHLVIVFNEPTPAAVVYWFVRWLCDDWKGQHLPKRPEVFPKQPALNGKLGNWLRVVGRHHTRDHWARLWNGDQWVEGDAAIDMVLACIGDPATLIPPEAAPPKPKRTPAPTYAPADARTVVNRCMAYISKMPDAISGSHGHDRTFNLACEIYRFGLDGSDARSVFDWINSNKTGGEQWNDEQIVHKLNDAKERVCADGEFGVRLREREADERIESALQRQDRRRRHAKETIGSALQRRTLDLSGSSATLTDFPIIETRKVG